MNLKRVFCGVVFSFLGVLARDARASSIITNGDFATGDLTGWTAYTTSGGTTGTVTVTPFDTGNGVSNAAQFSVGTADNAFNGTQRGGGLEQVIYAPSAGIYELTEDFAVSVCCGHNNGTPGEFSVLIDGVVVADHSLPAVGPLSSDTQTGSFDLDVTIGSAGANTIAFQITRPFSPGSGLTQYINGISLTELSATTTPEPSSAALLGTSLAALVVAFRRRRLLRS